MRPQMTRERGDAAEQGEPAGQRVPDLRLVPAAAAVWAVMALGLALGPVVGAAVALVAAGLTVVAHRRRRSSVLLAAAGCTAAAGLVIGAHSLLVSTHPLHDLAERGAAATLRVVVRDDPRAVTTASPAGGPAAARVVVAAELVEATAGAGRWSGGGRVLLLAPAEGWVGLLPGQAVTAEGLLAPPQRADLTIAVLRVRGAPRDVGAPPWWQSAAGGLRSGLRSAAAATVGPAEAGLLPGLAIGDTSALTTTVDDDFRAAGLTHLVAVSGANLAVLTGAVLAALRRLRADPRLSAVLAGVVLVGFVVLARPSPSVVRAAVMGAVTLVALAAGRGRSALPALAVAVLVLLLADPALAVDAGFALSVAATAALVLLAPPWADALRRRRMPRWVAEALAISTAAFLVTAPLVAGLGGLVSPVAVVANLLAEPAVAPATVLGVLAALVAPLAPPVARACVWLAGWPAAWLIAVADHAAAVPGAAVPWPSGTVGALLMAAALMTAVLVCRSRRRRAVVVAALAGVTLVVVPTRLVTPGWPPAGWLIVACDVGQGDAIVLATGRPGWVVLVDAGPEDRPIDACLDRLGVHGIAFVLLSHLHADHVGGLAGALHGRPVGGIGVGPVHEPAWALRDVAREAAAAGVPLVALAAGERLAWFGLTLDVLGPPHPAAFVDPDDGTEVNDGSVVVRATTPGGTILLSGDAELSEQADLLGSGALLRADILKMPHHGSRYSSPAFLAAVAPRAVLVSVGAGNTYGQPNVPLLTALQLAGAVVGRTDTAGDVAVTGGDTDGDGRPDLQMVTRGAPPPAWRRRAGSGRRRGRGRTGGGTRTRTVDHLKIVSPASWTTPATASGYGGSAESDRQVLAQLRDVSGGPHVVLRHLDLPVRVHHERGADHAGHGLAVHLLLPERAPGVEHVLVRVGQQGKGEPLLVTELRELGGLVGGDAEHVEARAVELGEVVPEIAGLLGATRGSGGWVEVHNDAAAAEVSERDGFPVRVGEGELGSGIAGSETGGHTPILARRPAGPAPCDLRCCLLHSPARQEASWRATRTPSKARSRRRGSHSPRASTCSASGRTPSGSLTRAGRPCSSGSPTPRSSTASSPWARSWPSPCCGGCSADRRGSVCGGRQLGGLLEG
ncbi:MAG: competence protein ComEC, partial [Pseudonocardiales bacterium]|nr:competence protein ComEC [Pseudonocardiales bacterium]